MDEVEQMWRRAKQRADHRWDRCRPSPGITAVLFALHRGPAHGSEVARRAGQSQPNVTAVWLPKLLDYGFVESCEAPGVGHQGGGRPAREWRLTVAGRRLALALRAEEESDAA